MFFRIMYSPGMSCQNVKQILPFFYFPNLKLFLSDVVHQFTSTKSTIQCLHVLYKDTVRNSQLQYLFVICPFCAPVPLSKPFANEEHSNFWISSERRPLNVYSASFYTFSPCYFQSFKNFRVDLYCIDYMLTNDKVNEKRGKKSTKKFLLS